MAQSKNPIQDDAEERRVDATSRKLNWQAAGRALRHRNFQLFFSGQLISLTGTWMQTVAQSWLVYRMTGSGLLLGAVGFASQIPVFLVAPIGGITADRSNRQRVVIGTQTASMILAFILAALTLANKIQVWHIFVLAALLGVVNAFDIPGRQAFLVDMVGKGDLMNAIALNSSMFNGARVIGPAVAGVLVARLGEGWCFFANGVSYIAVIIGLTMMKVHAPPRASLHTSPLEHIIEGFRFVNRTAPIRALLMLLGLVSVTGMPYVVLMPIFADRILHNGGQMFASMIGSHDLGAVRLGILMGAAGVGALLGALTLAARSGVKGLGRWISVCCAGFGVTLVLFSLSKSFWLSVLLLAAGGIFHHAANGGLEHVDSGDGAGCSARPHHGGVFHDVYGNGAGRRTAWRSALGPPRSPLDSGDRRNRFGARRVVVQRATAQNPRGGPKADHRSIDGWRRACRGDGDACSRRLKILLVRISASRHDSFARCAASERNQENGALSFRVRREEADHIVVVEGEAAGPEVLGVGSEIEFAPENASFELGRPISAISVALENLLQICQKEYVDRGVGRNLLFEPKIPCFVAEIPGLQEFQSLLLPSVKICPRLESDDIVNNQVQFIEM